jgi:hypothetical protein
MGEASRRDAGKRADGPTIAERQELSSSVRENHRLRVSTPADARDSCHSHQSGTPLAANWEAIGLQLGMNALANSVGSCPWPAAYPASSLKKPPASRIGGRQRPPERSRRHPLTAPWPDDKR